MQNQRHSYFWWAIKVACGFVLIAGLIERFIGAGLMQSFGNSLISVVVPIPIAQLLVLLGGGVYIWHYFILKRANQNVEQPEQMVQHKGLYGLVRHPMYFADMICYLGLALFWVSPVSLMVLLVSYVALVKQSQIEDAYIESRFKHQHEAWSSNSKLLIPFVC